MKIAALVLTIIFVIVSTLELIYSFLEKDKERKILKPFCMAFLAIIVILLLPNHPLIYIGLIFGLIGDIFLIFKKKIFFPLGVLSFLIGHLFFCAEVLTNLIGSLLPWYFYLIIAITIVFLSGILFKPLYDLKKDTPLAVGGALYFAVQAHALILMIIAVCYFPSTFMYFGILGYILFISSDAILVYGKFKNDFKRKHFYIMLTYLLAETFISLAFVLTFWPK